jgi:hypothetical protein
MLPHLWCIVRQLQASTLVSVPDGAIVISSVLAAMMGDGIVLGGVITEDIADGLCLSTIEWGEGRSASSGPFCVYLRNRRGSKEPSSAGKMVVRIWLAEPRTVFKLGEQE